MPPPPSTSTAQRPPHDKHENPPPRFPTKPTLSEQLDAKYYPQIKHRLDAQSALQAFRLYKSDHPRFSAMFSVESISEFCERDRKYRMRKAIRRKRDGEVVWDVCCNIK